MRGRVLVVGLVVALVSLPMVSEGAAAQTGGTRYLDVLFDEVAVTADVVYGQAVNSQGQMQDLLLDVYEPVGDEAEDRGLYIWAHGGGFRRGSKASTGPLLDYVQRGWVGISMTYRVRPDMAGNAAIGIITNPDQIEMARAAAKDAQHDMQAAVRWARANAAELGIHPARIAVGGISAGGITALMTAFNGDDPGTSGNPGYPSHVAAAVSHAGAYIPVLQGGFPGAGAPPVALYHGTTDEQVPYPAAPIACLLTLLLGNTCEFVTFVGRHHLTLGADLALDFLYRHVITGVTEPARTHVVQTDDELQVVVGSEPPDMNLGANLGVVVPTDPAVVEDSTVEAVSYVLRALGLPDAL